MGRRNKILVPAARKDLDLLKARVSRSSSPDEAKYEVAREQGIPLSRGYNGDIKAKDAGRIGGGIGGGMVREMVKMAEEQLKKKR